MITSRLVTESLGDIKSYNKKMDMSDNKERYSISIFGLF